MMNQELYSARVLALRDAMLDDAAGVAPAYGAEPIPSGELDAVRAAMKAMHIDPDGATGQRLEDVWVEDGLDAAMAEIVRYKAQQPAHSARYKAEQGLNPNGIRTDSGRLIGAPVRDERGRPLY